MTTTDENRRRAAKAFVERWTYRRGSEKGEDQQFWNDLLRSVLGVEDVEARIRYQVPVPMGGSPSPAAAKTTKFLDAWIPETRVLIEHKSRGVDLAAPQAGHGGLTPYGQACEYDNARTFDERARWIVTCNFDRFEIHDRAKPLAPPLVLRLRDLPKEVYRLAFLVDPKEKAIARELEISVRAGRIVGELYDALLARYAGGAEGCLTRSGGEAERADLYSSNPVNPVNPVKNARDLRASPRIAPASQLASLGGYASPREAEVAPDALAALNRLCVRLVFCLYAEDAGVFPKDCLRRLVEATPAEFLRTRLAQLFRVLDTPPARRDPYLEPELAAFPYTNGGLFRTRRPHAENAEGAEGGDGDSRPDARDDIPPLTEEIRQLLLGACRFDWREITPTIFGALFESTLNPETRRAGGMVYTSVANIHKVIGPLFLDGLTAELDAILAAPCSNPVNPVNPVRRFGSPRERDRRLAAFQERLASLTFLDPACGSGNFLTETYVCLRRLENRLIAARQRGQGELDLGLTVKVSLAQFRGIEVNDFAVAVAKTALWIAEAQMRRETAEILHREPDYLPLRDYDGIVEGNALRVDWPRADYIMGNPPFVGRTMKSREQQTDIARFFDYRDIDYVACWYAKAAALMAGTSARAAFVSTNSITQGEQVAPLWRPLFERYGLVIDFAWRTFRWDSEASEKAHVHCVIVGFHAGGRPAALNTEETEKGRHGEEAGGTQFIASADCGRNKLRPSPSCPSNPVNLVNPVKKTPCLRPSEISALGAAGTLPKVIYGADGTPRAAANVCPYLIDAPTVFVAPRPRPLCDVPRLIMGNMPLDGGALIVEERDRAAFLAREPGAAPFLRRLMGSKELINNLPRWCLWLKDVSPATLRALPAVMERIAKCRAMRTASRDAGTRKHALTPWLFRETNNPASAVVIPKVSSERREYVPMGFLDDSVIVTDLAFLLPGAAAYHFGVLTSSVHMAWMRTVAGRLKSDYRYSAAVVYNNFPWPEGGLTRSGGEAAPSGTQRTDRTQRTGAAGAAVAGETAPERAGEAAAGDCPVRPVRPMRPSAQVIAATAQGILDARARYPGASLADLYDPLTMPPDLRAAHEANDRAVLAAYGLKPDTPESEIVAHLFRLYAEKTKGQG